MIPVSAARRRLLAFDGYSRTETPGVRWMALHDGTAYGAGDAGTWITTTDGLTLTDTGASCVYGGLQVIDMHADSQGFLVHTAGAIDAAGIPSGTGAVWSGASLGSMADITPATWTPGTCGRPSMIDRNSAGVIIVGQYTYTHTDALVHQSTDAGATWTTTRLQDTRFASGYTRHVHAVHFDPWDPTVAWATVGDDPGGPRGLYKSTNSGASWSIMANSAYPIDFGFLPDGTFVGEGDGNSTPHIVTWHPDGGGLIGAITPAMAEAATGQTDWRGTTRGVAILGPDQIFYTTTAEEGVTGTRWGIWAATRTDGVWAPHLLEELPARWMVMGKTLRIGPRTLLCYRYCFTL